MEFNADYHIHYYMDVCAWRDMKMPDIDEAVYRKGLTEIAILCHCSAMRPAGGAEWKEWDFWHTFNPDRFHIYMYDFARHRSAHHIKTYSGIETELLDGNGSIAAPDEILNRIDFAAVSLHYLPDLTGGTCRMEAFPNGPADDPEYRQLFAAWREKYAGVRTEDVIEAVADGYIAAIRKNPKVRSMAHLDCMDCLAYYGFDPFSVAPDRLTEILEPLMKTAAENDVLWELSGTVKEHRLFDRARELGVSFSPTSDAHSLNGTWGRLSRRDPAAAFMERNHLKAGRLILR